MKTALKTILVAAALVGFTAQADANERVTTQTTHETYVITTKQEVGSENTTNRAYGKHYNAFSKDYRQPEPLASGYVVQLQKQLAAQGYYEGDIDGLWGTQTTDAVRAYQEDRGMPVTGHLSSTDLEKMGVIHSSSSVAETRTTIYPSNISERPVLRD